MSKFMCLCGHIIRDNTENLPYKASFFSDQDYEAAYLELISHYTNLIQAREKGQQEKFVADHFGEEYPKNLDISDILHDMLAGARSFWSQHV